MIISTIERKMLWVMERCESEFDLLRGNAEVTRPEREEGREEGAGIKGVLISHKEDCDVVLRPLHQLRLLMAENEGAREVVVLCCVAVAGLTMKWKRLAGWLASGGGISPFRSRKSAQTPVNYNPTSEKNRIPVPRYLARLEHLSRSQIHPVFLSSSRTLRALSPLYSADRHAYGSLHDIHLQEKAYNYNHGHLNN